MKEREREEESACTNFREYIWEYKLLAIRKFNQKPLGVPPRCKPSTSRAAKKESWDDPVMADG